MNIKLPRDQEQWLEAQVAQGVFPSVEDAVHTLIAERMGFEADDFAWAKPYVDAARESVARGEVGSLDDAIGDMDAHLATLKR
jgi:antitoxin ParD1/3/4